MLSLSKHLRPFGYAQGDGATSRHIMLSLSKHLRPFGYAQGDGATLRITMALPGPHKWMKMV